MTESLFILRNSADFARGSFENIAQCGEMLCLEQAAGRYVQAGCYTTAELTVPACNAVLTSWNCDTPRGTACEVQIRIFARGMWSRWMSYGKWSPFIRRQSVQNPVSDGDAVTLNGGTVHINCPGGAEALQLRIYLYSDDTQATPTVRLLAASVRPLQWQRTDSDPIQQRLLPCPAYTQNLRNPRFVGKISDAIAITMLMNRWGEDLLPEEVAHTCYDFAAGANRSFTAALAGCYGYECFLRYADLAFLKKEVKNGFACAAAVHYAADADTALEKKLPLIDGAPCTAQRHVLIVRGFETEENGTEYVLVNDSRAATDDSAVRRYPLAQFAAAWTGEIYCLHTKQNLPSLCPPVRNCAEVRSAEVHGEWALYCKGERTSLPLDYTVKDGLCTGTVCFALHDSSAHATTAHKQFFYGDVSESGNLTFDTQHLPVGTKATVFVINSLGNSAVAELKL